MLGLAEGFSEQTQERGQERRVLRLGRGLQACSVERDGDLTQHMHMTLLL